MRGRNSHERPPMSMQDPTPSREQVDAMEDPVLLEFGASWCGHCLLLAPELLRTLEQYPTVRHIRVEDGPGRRLGRSFGVKLWPTLVLMRGGEVVDRLVRPEPEAVRQALARFVTD